MNSTWMHSELISINSLKIFNNLYFGFEVITDHYSLVHDFLYTIGAAGSINISNILTGKCLAKIKASNGLLVDECCCSSSCGGRSCSSRKSMKASRIKSTVAEALEDITALFYDEDRNEIYTGNRLGLVHVWSN